MIAGGRRSRRSRAVLGAAVLALLAVLVSLMRPVLLPEARVLRGDSVWRVGYEVRFRANEASTALRVSVPIETRTSRIIASRFSHPGLRVQRPAARASAVRDWVVVAARPGTYTVALSVDLHLTGARGARMLRAEPLDDDDRTRYLADEDGIEVQAPEVGAVLRPLVTPDQSSADLIDTLYRFVRLQLGDSGDLGAADAARVLGARAGSGLGRARALVALARGAGLPARLVGGLIVATPAPGRLRYWTEIYHEERWRGYDPVRGHAGVLPPEYIPLRRDAAEPVRATGASEVRVRVDVSREAVPDDLPGASAPSALTIFDLTRLPLVTRETLALLLMLPFGVLLNLCAQRLFGLNTYGTFSATLLALAATAVDWLTSAILFLLVIVVAISGRALMPALRLTRAPRLSLVFLLIAMSIAFIVSAMEHFQLGSATVALLLPMVVLTNLTDRVYTVADEQGLREALTRLAATVLVAVLAYLLFLHDDWALWVLAHPEIHLFTAAIMILVSVFRRAPARAVAETAQV